MKFVIKKELLNMNCNNNCYCLPSELFSKEYSKFSIKSKVLFSMVVTEADNGASINELAKLIETIGTRKVSALHSQIKKELNEHQSKGA